MHRYEHSDETVNILKKFLTNTNDEWDYSFAESGASLNQSSIRMELFAVEGGEA